MYQMQDDTKRSKVFVKAHRLFTKPLLSLTLSMSGLIPYANAASYQSGGITSGLKGRLDQLISTQNKSIAAIALDQNNHWVIVTPENERYYSDLDYFDAKKGFRPKLNQLLAEGKKIEAIAFTPGDNWVIVTEQDTYYSSVAAFQNIGFHQKLEHLKNQLGVKIKSIAFGPHQFWAIATATNTYYNTDASDIADIKETELIRIINDLNLQDRAIDQIAIRLASTGKPQFAISSGSRIFTYPRHAALTDVAEGNFKFLRNNDHIALDKDDGFLVISDTSRATSLTNPDKLELTLSYKEDCDGNGENCTTKYGSLWERMKAHNIAGMQIAIIDANKLQEVRSYGYRHYSKQKPVLSTTRFSAASISKAVAGTTFLKGAELFQLNLEGTIWRDLKYYVDRHDDSYLGTWYKWLNQTEKGRVSGTAIGDLLSSTGGYNVHGIGLYEPDNMPTLSDILRGKSPWTGDRVDPDYEPRTRYQYSGGGFTLAQAVFELEGKQSYATFADENVLKPLQMYQSKFSRLTEAEREAYLAYGHNSAKTAYPFMECPSDAAGGLYTTAGDYSKFLLMLMNRGKTSPSKTFLTEDALRTALTPRVLKGGSGDACTASNQCDQDAGESCYKSKCEKVSYYGYGVSLSQSRTSDDFPVTMSHTGAQDGYRTYFYGRNDDKEGIVILINTHKDAGADAMADELAARFKALY